MTLQVSSIRVESVSPEKAAEFLACNYSHQRKLDKRYAEFLAAEMRAGRFISTAEVHIVYRNGEPVLVNGQHTCAAIRIFGKPVSVTVRKSQVREPGEIALIYAFGHDTGKKRTFGDGLGAYNIGESVGLGSQRLKELSGALRFIYHGFSLGAGRVPLPDMLEQMQEWAPLMRSFFGNVDSTDARTKRIAASRGVLSVILVTLRYQNLRALPFWKNVFDPTDLQWNDHAAVTRRTIDDSDSYRERKRISGDNLSVVMARRVAYDWGVFFSESKASARKKAQAVNSQIVIAGTPYAGDRVFPWWPE